MATFITCIGYEALRIYNALPFAYEAEKGDLDRVLDKMQKYCLGETNVIYERFRFNGKTQQDGESFDNFLTNLIELAKTCQFGTMHDALLRDRIVVGVRDDALRKQLLQKRELTLSECISICRASETTALQMKDMSAHDTVHAMAVRAQRWPSSNASRGTTRSKTSEGEKVCKYCGKCHRRGRQYCKAFGKQCQACHKMNHFTHMCKSKATATTKKKSIAKLHLVEGDMSSSDTDSPEYGNDRLVSLTLTPDDDESVNVLNDSATTYPNRLYANLRVKRRQIKFQIDTGATCNVIRRQDMPIATRLEQTKQVLTLYDGSRIKPLGRCTLEVRNPKNGNVFRSKFVVVDDARTESIIGASSAQEMGLIQLNMENVQAITTQQKQQRHKTKPMTKESVMQKYPLVFQGELGRLAGKVHLMVDETIMPTKQPVRRVPIAIKEQLQKELQRMEEMGVIAKEEQSTDWISSLVTVKKPNGKIRVCIDPKPLNRALIRSQYLMPTLEDLLPELAEARIFSVLDVRNGFWHISLDDQSSKLTAFGTPFGKYCWKRLPFGVSTAPEIFQERLNAAIQGIRGVYTVADDLLIIGKGSTEAIAREDHDKNLTALLDRCQEKGIKLNGEKCQIATQKVKYMGHVLSSDGLLSDSAKIEAIQKMPRPTNVAGIRRFIGMTGYLSRFLGHLSDLCEPLRQLTKQCI